MYLRHSEQYSAAKKKPIFACISMFNCVSISGFIGSVVLPLQLLSLEQQSHAEGDF